MVLFVLTLVAFVGSTSSVSLTPFLLAVADDLGTDLAAISMLFTYSNVPWAIVSLVAGPLSDRLGRKPVMLAGVALMAASGFGTALAQDYPSLVFWRIVTGLGGGTQMSTVFAAAAEVGPPAQRGKSLGWVMTGQSLSLVLGAPISALIGSVGGWRWAVGALGLAGVATLLLLVWLAPSGTRSRPGPERREASLARLVANRATLALFAASACERVCYSGAVIFFATFLIATYQVSTGWLAGALIVVALGNIIGNQLGGLLSDRLGNRFRLVSVAMLLCGLLALPLLTWAPAVLVSVALGLLYNFTNGLGRPPLIWLISQISREGRGALMGLQITVSGLGWITASTLGGWLVVAYGFGSLGLLAAVCGAGSATFAALAGLFAAPAIRGQSRPGRSAAATS